MTTKRRRNLNFLVYSKEKTRNYSQKKSRQRTRQYPLAFLLVPTFLLSQGLLVASEKANNSLSQKGQNVTINSTNILISSNNSAFNNSTPSLGNSSFANTNSTETTIEQLNNETLATRQEISNPRSNKTTPASPVIPPKEKVVQLQPPKLKSEETINREEHRQYQQFMDWCHQVMGIQTSLEIHTFYYYDYMTAVMTNPSKLIEDDDEDDDDDYFGQLPSSNDNNNKKMKQQQEWQDPPKIPVRGLRATRTIEQGEIVISIPFQALLTVSTTIDQDPILSQVMGPEARRAYGWVLEQDKDAGASDENASVEDIDFFELPLLAMALLHHYKLGTSSPMYPYINMLRNSPVDSMPFLWNKEQRQKHYYGGNNNLALGVANNGIRTVARSIRLEMKDMYHSVVDTLVKNHPDLFGKKEELSEYDMLDDDLQDDWAFSYENFQWAFAMVNSRHWLLPIVDLESPPPATYTPPSPMMMQPQGSVDGVPPAEMPTDAWLDQQLSEEEDADNSNKPNDDRSQQEQPKPQPPRKASSAYHSFLAPVADLLNFGPPCTRGRYNQEKHTFDIIASCNFTAGQEVTFWYSDECEDIIIGNYGFTHPMVPKCPTIDDYRQARDKWKQRAANLQGALEDAYEDMDIMDTGLQHAQRILANCDCCDTNAAAAAAYDSEAEDAEAERQEETSTQHEQQQSPPAEAIPQQQPQVRPKQQPSVSAFHGNNYLRNPHDRAGGGGGARGMMSISTGGGGGNSGRSGHHHGLDHDRESRSQSRSNSRGGRSGANSGDDEDDVERHGVRRMWTARSLL